MNSITLSTLIRDIFILIMDFPVEFARMGEYDLKTPRDLTPGQYVIYWAKGVALLLAIPVLVIIGLTMLGVIIWHAIVNLPTSIVLTPIIIILCVYCFAKSRNKISDDNNETRIIDLKGQPDDK